MHCFMHDFSVQQGYSIVHEWITVPVTEANKHLFLHQSQLMTNT